MLSVWSTSFRVNYGNSMVEINSTNFVSSLELPFLCVCRIFSINALNQYNPSLESRVGKNMFSLSLNSLSKQIVQNQSVITGSLSSILQPRSSPSSWWSNAGSPCLRAPSSSPSSSSPSSSPSLWLSEEQRHHWSCWANITLWLAHSPPISQDKAFGLYWLLLQHHLYFCDQLSGSSSNFWSFTNCREYTTYGQNIFVNSPRHCTLTFRLKSIVNRKWCHPSKKENDVEKNRQRRKFIWPKWEALAKTGSPSDF